MAAKTTSFLYFHCTLTLNFRFLHDLELINLSVMFFDENDVYLTFKFRMVTDKKSKCVFMHLNYNIKKTYLFNRNLKNRLGNTAD